jgi:hypothetical protein
MIKLTYPSINCHTFGSKRINQKSLHKINNRQQRQNHERKEKEKKRKKRKMG